MNDVTTEDLMRSLKVARNMVEAYRVTQAIDQELMRQALDAINGVLSGGDFDHPYADIKQAAAALKERLK
jgi:hypothetical protein